MAAVVSPGRVGRFRGAGIGVVDGGDFVIGFRSCGRYTTGGDRAAAFYSLIGSAKLNGLDPELYLRMALTQIADHSVSRINELLPWNLVYTPDAKTSSKAA